MSTTTKTAEELAAELEAQKEATTQQIEDAGEQAKKEAESQGASQEEIKAAVERARTEEKNKLYPQLEALKDSIKEIQETLRAEREEKERIKKEAQDKEEKRRVEKLSDSEKTLEAIRKLEEKLEDERKAREASDLKWTESEKKREINEYRAQVIKAAGDEIIPELVAGTTVEEIDKSVQIAKARYTELAERFKAEHGESTRRRMPRSTNPSTEALEEEELSEQLTSVDHDKYLQDPVYREKIKGELERAYERAAGRR